MVDISGGSYNEVRSNVISGVEFFHVLLSYISDVFPDSVGWLRDVVVSEWGEVYSFKSGSFLVLGVFKTISVNLVSLSFYLIFIIIWI